MIPPTFKLAFGEVLFKLPKLVGVEDKDEEVEEPVGDNIEEDGEFDA